MRPLRSDMVADEMLAEVARLALGVVAGHRATFTRPNVYAEALRQLHGVRFAGPAERIAVAERVTDLAMGQALRLTPPDIEVLPERLRRPDGTSRLRPRDSEVYSTVEILDAETRLVDAGPRHRRPGRRRPPSPGPCAPRRWMRPGGCCRPSRRPLSSRW